MDPETPEEQAIKGGQANATGARKLASGRRIGDRSMLLGLLARIRAEEHTGTVMADRSCDTGLCHAAIAARQVMVFDTAPTYRLGS